MVSVACPEMLGAYDGLRLGRPRQILDPARCTGGQEQGTGTAPGPPPVALSRRSLPPHPGPVFLPRPASPRVRTLAWTASHGPTPERPRRAAERSVRCRRGPDVNPGLLDPPRARRSHCVRVQWLRSLSGGGGRRRGGLRRAVSGVPGHRGDVATPAPAFPSAIHARRASHGVPARLRSSRLSRLSLAPPVQWSAAGQPSCSLGRL